MVGVDIVKIDRIDNLESKDHFIQRVFSKKEREYIEKREYSSQTIAGMFAAKEAILKVFGTGFGEISFNDIEILHDDKGKPIVRLSEKAKEYLKKGGLGNITVSISHENEYAIATATGENKKYKKRKDIKYQADLAMSILKRDKYGHKGNYGKVGIIGGSTGMVGSVYLSSSASFRTGSGLVYLLVPKSIKDVLQIKCVEQIVIPIEDDNTGHFTENSIDDLLREIKKLDAIAVGPGMGSNDANVKILRAILKNVDKPMVIDADGLNRISKDISMLDNKKVKPIFTPHEVEMARLIKSNALNVKNNRVEIAQKFAKEKDVILLLKGYETIITDGRIYYFNASGNPGMATAGSGDILTGIILSFIGQNYQEFLSARLGAYVHGLAGDISKEKYGEAGMIASDMLVNIAKAMKLLMEISDEL